MFSYLLVTPARDEEAYIGHTLESVVNQTVPPTRWVIVDDGSVDQTAAMVASFAERYPWIQLVQRPRRSKRSFASKVEAFNAGYGCIAGLKHDIIGSLDADVSFAPDYIEFLLNCFRADEDLGVAGTFFLEDHYDSSRDSFEGCTHVAGGCQLFRRQCFEEVGGFIPNKAGGVDWIAVTTARMKGWRTRAFKEKSFFHHRTLGTAKKGAIAAMFCAGQKDYFLGKHPLPQLLRVLYRMTKKPVGLGGLALLLGYSWAMLLRKERPITPKLMQFRRREDMVKLGRLASAALHRKPVDKFYLLDWTHSRPLARRPYLVRERYMPSLFTVAVSVAVAMAGGYGYFVWQRTQTPQALFESGKKYYEQKNYQEAKIQLVSAVQKDPGDKEARLLLSRVFAATGNLNAASAQLKALLEYYPDDPTGILELANLYQSWFE